MSAVTAPRVPRAGRRPGGTARRGRTGGGRALGSLAPTAVLLLGTVYCLLPVAWVVVAATKTNGELFADATFAPSTALWANVAELSAYGDGVFWRWMANTAFYAGLGAALSALLSALTGYTLAKYEFRGRETVFRVLLAGVLVPQIALAVPQYLLLADAGLTDSYWSVLVLSVFSPYGMYLARVYAQAAVPDEVVEAARADGCSEGRIFARIALPMMLPGLVTIFLFQFVAIWNNFLLPFIMLGDDRKFPLTLGIYTLLNQGTSLPALYTLALTGALLSIIPLVALFLTLQRYWRVDLVSGAIKG
ncbi:carbohydrate ABC transporter permease [Marinactinospora rubrisoli]|uniref:Carbohydrate ABC transporter permease n=1 Tax=Marinactinospora rubrisoli TaxID=2715399 RepID=A0ABW2KGB5_9ACTN